MRDIPTSWDIDDIPEETLDRLRQYEPTEDELRKFEAEREGETIKLGELLNRIADYAEGYAKELTTFSESGGHVMKNPLEATPPYEMSNPSFVYWCFEANKVPLHGKLKRHTVREIMHSTRLETVYNVGSNVNLDGLLRGDLLFFNNDRHVGIYIGNGEFVSMGGPNREGFSGGVRTNSLEEGYWDNLFKGHVKRLVR